MNVDYQAFVVDCDYGGVSPFLANKQFHDCNSKMSFHERGSLCVCVRLGTVLARKTWLHHQNNLDQSFTHQRFAQASEMGQLEDDANAKNTSQNHIPEIDITHLSFDVHLWHRQLWLDHLRHSVSVTKAFAAFSWIMGECGPLATSQCNVETKGIIYLSWNKWLYLELENIA